MKNYFNYVSDKSHMKQYSEYQKKYAITIRESDKILLDLIGKHIEEKHNREMHLLDIGCSTGNLLLHIRHRFPKLKLTGADLADIVITENRNNSVCNGINFEVMDVMNLDNKYDSLFDIITANVMLFVFSQDEFRKALQNLNSALKPDGILLIFDLFHPFEQEVAIIETTKAFPSGLPIYFRSFSAVTADMLASGFTGIKFMPFIIPIDLEKSPDPYSIQSYTITNIKGERMSFRGTLYQPWCHFAAQKKY